MADHRKHGTNVYTDQLFIAILQHLFRSFPGLREGSFKARRMESKAGI